MGLMSSKRQHTKYLLVSSSLFVLFVKNKYIVSLPIQIRKGGTKDGNITAARKHDHGETSGLASVAFINGVTRFLVCFLLIADCLC